MAETHRHGRLSDLGCAVLTVARFISFEGGEGAGKTTQLNLLAARLAALGRAVVTTREPGGTAGAEAIRALLVQGAAERWHASTELLLLTAARDDHVRRVIRPALAAGRWVLCDRFVDSTRVYQGIAAGLGIELVDRLHALMLDGLQPDLAIVLDLDPELGLARHAGGRETRFERKGLEFHKRVREGFRTLAAGEPRRIILIDAADPVARVTEAVWAAVVERLAP